jgi:hypothetical protein
LNELNEKRLDHPGEPIYGKAQMPVSKCIEGAQILGKNKLLYDKGELKKMTK